MVYVLYDSFTGQTKKFAEGLEFKEIYPIEEYDKVPDNAKVFLCTRSFNFGDVPELTVRFLKENFKRLNIIGVAVSGNKNWGELYGSAGKKIEKVTKIPLVCIFEGSGFKSDIEMVRKFIEENNQND